MGWGGNRFHNPNAVASTFSWSITGGMAANFHRSTPDMTPLDSAGVSMDYGMVRSGRGVGCGPCRIMQEQVRMYGVGGACAGLSHSDANNDTCIY